MRQYRGLTKDGKWVYGWYLKTRFPETHWIINDGLYVTDILIGINPKFPKHLQGCYEVIPETVGQQVGLKDKKRTKEFPEGQEICEGDIVKLDEDLFAVKHSNQPIIDTVNLRFRTWLKNEHQGYEGEDFVSPQFTEVIGNIHQNPESLENRK